MKDSHEGTKTRRDTEELSGIVVDCGYLLLLKLPLDLVINFDAPAFKEGCQRIVNGPQSFVSSRLRVNQNHGLSAYEQK